jgi:hypothetical protein
MFLYFKGLKMKKLLFFISMVLILSAQTIHYGKGYRFDKNGWIYVHIEGKAYERGKQLGYLTADRFKKALNTFKYITYEETGRNWEFFKKWAYKLYWNKIPKEYQQEIKGIAAGYRAHGVRVDYKDVLLWNSFVELLWYWYPHHASNFYKKDHTKCSAFIATGSYTKDGKIVMGHNSWCNFEMCQFLNVIVDIKPEKGFRILMQEMPGLIFSMSDFFVTSAGIIGTETTIGGFSPYNEKGIPEYVRIRKAMQYGKTLDDYVKILLKGNTGGYANDWLFGNIKTNEIMRFELGLKFHKIWRTKDGFYAGFNAPLDPRIRNMECSDTGIYDIRRHQGARRVRFWQLAKKYKGKIDLDIAEKIMADHYDVYLNKINPSSRTIDGHYELDNRAYMSDPSRPVPYQPRGAVDGKVVTSDLAKNMSFYARWGNSSGMPFNAKEFLEKHPQWIQLKPYLEDRPSEPWTKFTSGEKQ